MDITIRFNEGRMVATFDNQSDLNKWLKSYGPDLHQPFMYTIHGLGGVKELKSYLKELNCKNCSDMELYPDETCPDCGREG